jgi:hypothetical protein
MKHPGNSAPGQSKPQNATQQPPPARPRKRPSPTYHRIKCNVCSRPERDAIDEAFLRWQSPQTLAHTYGIADRSSIYRHARATGLFSRRRRKLSSALESIIEHADRIVPTATEIVMAVKMYSQFNKQGQWIEPPKRRLIHRINASGASPSAAPNRSPHQESRN